MSEQTFWLIFITICGLCIGSFLNVVIYRLPLSLPIASGRSMCPTCQHPLSALDLVPVFSFLFLKRKCRYCDAPISWRYPIIELLTACLFALCVIQFGLSIYCILMCLLMCLLICCAMIDWDHGYLPDRMHVIILILAVVSYFYGPSVSVLSRLIGGIGLGTLMLLLSIFTHGGIGGGDIKLVACCGLLLGAKLIVPAFFAAYLLAAIRYLPAYLSKKIPAKFEVRMAPYFALSIAFFALFGDSLIDAYLSLF